MKKTKLCNRCKTREKTSYSHTYCKECLTILRKKWYQNNRKEIAAYAKARRLKYPEREVRYHLHWAMRKLKEMKSYK